MSTVDTEVFYFEGNGGHKSLPAREGAVDEVWRGGDGDDHHQSRKVRRQTKKSFHNKSLHVYLLAVNQCVFILSGPIRELKYRPWSRLDFFVPCVGDLEMHSVGSCRENTEHLVDALTLRSSNSAHRLHLSLQGGPVGKYMDLPISLQRMDTIVGVKNIILCVSVCVCVRPASQQHICLQHVTIHMSRCQLYVCPLTASSQNNARRLERDLHICIMTAGVCAHTHTHTRTRTHTCPVAHRWTMNIYNSAQLHFIVRA